MRNLIKQGGSAYHILRVYVVAIYLHSINAPIVITNSN